MLFLGNNLKQKPYLKFQPCNYHLLCANTAMNRKKWVKSLIQCFNLTLKLWNNANLAVQAQLHRLSFKYRTYWISLKLTKIYAWKDFNFCCLTNLFIIVFTFWNKNKDHYHHYFCELNILDCTHALIGQKLSCLFCQTHSYFIKALDRT